MIFSELYSVYYNAVAKILRAAVDHPVSEQEMRRIIEEEAFSESVLQIEPALTGERWQLLHKDGTTPLRQSPSMPLTHLQKRWLKAISLDPRVQLFDFHVPGLEETQPLFVPEDVYVFDQYADGDPYADKTYCQHFRLILDAVQKRYPLRIQMQNRRGKPVHTNVMPEHLEYSEKDDKFRLFTTGCRYGKVINLARILSCEPYPGELPFHPHHTEAAGNRTLVMELVDSRNALERVMLHFAHFEKTAQRLDDRRYRVEIPYSTEDETELIIRVLSFGPLIQVVEPECFINQIRERLQKQKSCGL